MKNWLNNLIARVGLALHTLKKLWALYTEGSRHITLLNLSFSNQTKQGQELGLSPEPPVTTLLVWTREEAEAAWKAGRTEINVATLLPENITSTKTVTGRFVIDGRPTKVVVCVDEAVKHWLLASSWATGRPRLSQRGLVVPPSEPPLCGRGSAHECVDRPHLPFSRGGPVHECVDRPHLPCPACLKGTGDSFATVHANPQLRRPRK